MTGSKDRKALTAKLRAVMASLNAGQLDAAENSCRDILADHPDNADALHLSAIAAQKRGNLQDAVRLFERTVSLRPDFAAARSNLGVALTTLGRYDEAVAALREAVKLDPDSLAAHGNLGAAYLELDRPKEAAREYNAVLARDPKSAEAHSSLGVALIGLARPEEAESHCREALELAPGNAGALNNLGLVLRELGRLDESLAACREALAADPTTANAHNNLGTALLGLGNPDEAEAAFRECLRLRPDFVKGMSNLAVALQNQGRLREALDIYDRALQVNPDFTEALSNKGNVLKDEGRTEEALATYRQARELHPESADVHSNLIFCLSYDPAATAADIFAEARRWNEIHAAAITKRAPRPTNDRDPERRLRVGYVSPDFRRHSVAYFIEPIIEAHHREEVEVYGYADLAKPDAMTERIRGAADHWRVITGQAAPKVADRIRRDRIDILVDLAGHSGQNRLLVFAERPAPVQITWLGFGGSTGMTAMDYRLSDAVADPEGEADRLHSESLIRLECGFLCYRPPDEAPPVSPPPVEKQGHVTFGSFNNITKATPEVARVWAAILERVPGSRLVLKNRALADPPTRRRYRDMFAANGLGAERLDLLPWSPTTADHLGAYDGLDIALDPFPYNGGTTVCEALWMGVPVVALAGDHHVGRMAASMLTRVGLTELIAGDEAGYIAMAVDLAGDTKRLATSRAGLRTRMAASPLTDADRFAGTLEAAYRAMWRRWCAGGQAPPPGDAPRAAPANKSSSSSSAPSRPGLGEALAHHRAGRLDAAREIYADVLAGQPDEPSALYYLGILDLQRGDAALALPLLEKSAARRPEHAEAQNNFGVALADVGRHEDAAEACRRAIALKPDYVEAHGNLGGVLRDLGRPAEAIECFRRALDLRPERAVAHKDMALALVDLGRADEAAEAAERAVALDPAQAGGHGALGVARHAQGRRREAVTCLERAIEIDPNAAELHNNLGVVRVELGELDAAIESCRRALTLKPDYAEAESHLGMALAGQGDLDKAAAACRKAVESSPDWPGGYNNLAVVLTDLGQVESAEAACRQAIALGPDSATAHNNLGAALIGQSRLDDAMAAYRQALDLAPDHVAAHDNLICAMTYHPDLAAEDVFAECQRWDTAHGAPLAARAKPHDNDRDPARRLRVGYVSPDFREHSVASFLEPLFDTHDRARVEIFGYAEIMRPDASTKRLRELADGWRSTVGLSDAEMATKVREDHIDILVDLTGHLARNRLRVFAERPAPVQIAWLGFPASTGMGALDYRLSDQIADPEGEADRLYSETLVRLPDGFLCYGPPDDAPDVAPPPSVRHGHVTFGSFNNLAKITPAVIALWAEILNHVPGARLLLKSKEVGFEGAHRRLHQAFAAHGIAAERLELRGHARSRRDHLATYAEVDLSLDPFPYNGNTTICESLWMGAPALTLRGDRTVGRVASSLLTRVDLPELIAENPDAYRDLAVALAVDGARLAELRAGLRERMAASALCDAPKFARAIEDAYRAMWRRWCAGREAGINPS